MIFRAGLEGVGLRPGMRLVGEKCGRGYRVLQTGRLVQESGRRIRQPTPGRDELAFDLRDGATVSGLMDELREMTGSPVAFMSRDQFQKEGPVHHYIERLPPAFVESLFARYGDNWQRDQDAGVLVASLILDAKRWRKEKE